MIFFYDFLLTFSELVAHIKLKLGKLKKAQSFPEKVPVHLVFEYVIMINFFLISTIKGSIFSLNNFE